MLYRYRNILMGLALGLVGLAHAAEEPPSTWPDKLVAYEDLRALTPFRMKVPGVVVHGGVRGPSTLRVHVDPQGAVVKALLLQSCGNADLDSAAVRGMQEMKFSPYRSEGVPVDVSLVVPIHVPKQLGRSR